MDYPALIIRCNSIYRSPLKTVTNFTAELVYVSINNISFGPRYQKVRCEKCNTVFKVDMLTADPLRKSSLRESTYFLFCALLHWSVIH